MVRHEHTDGLSEYAKKTSSWISPDICVGKDVTLSPGKEILAPIGYSLPVSQFFEKKSIQWTPAYNTICHTRSHMAQQGLEASVVDWDGFLHTAAWASCPPAQVMKLVNRSPNTLYIPRDTGVCNFIEFREGPLKGDRLTSAIKKSVEFANGHWQFWTEGDEEVGLEFLINPAVHFLIKKQTAPLGIDGRTNGNHGRDDIAERLEAVPAIKEKHFWVGELATPIFIKPEIHGVITGMYRPEGADSIHAPSVLLQGGRTGESKDNPSRIRIEAYGRFNAADRVRVQFYSA